MEGQKNASRPHCLVLAYPRQGHINPMVEFSKRLEHKGVKVTLVTTYFVSKTMNKEACPIPLETISDGYDEGGRTQGESRQAYFERFRLVGSQTLTKLVEKLSTSDYPVDCIVYDAFLPWVLDVAKKFGLIGAVFFTQSCAVDNIYYHVHKGVVEVPLSESEILLPGMPPLRPQELPSFICNSGSFPDLIDIAVRQFSNVHEADWVLINSFYELEQELWPVRTIGPTIPSMFLDKRLEGDKEYGFSIFNTNITCLKWLNDRPKGSVVYVSFGSLAALEVEQMEEVAWGLRMSNSYFLWVVRASDEAKLPKNLVEDMSEKGLVVQWCPQLGVLSHESVGCFVTHCGWNSTLEALSFGVPVVAVPHWSDQSTNAKYITDVWKMGLKAPIDEKGFVRHKALENCIREIMEGEMGKEIQKNSLKWRKLAKEVVDESGRSDKNIGEFAA